MNAPQFPNWLLAPKATTSPFPSLPDSMKRAKRWLVHRRKVPYYIDGAPRGETDTPGDVSRFATFGDAVQKLQAGGFDGIGFALGPDETGDRWQGIDLDKIEENGLQYIADSLPGYVERSPSGKGLHAIGFGGEFHPLGSNGTGIEAYAGARYFTVTGDAVRNDQIGDLVSFIEKVLLPRHGDASKATRAASSTTGAPITEGGRNATLMTLAGSMRARGMSQQAIEGALQIENQSRCQPPLDEREVARIAASVSRYPPSIDPAPNVTGMFGPVGGDDWPDPHPLPDLPPVPNFDLDLLPKSIWPWIADVSERLQLPPDIAAIGAVTALSSAVGRRVRIRPMQNDPWTVVPNLWGMVVAPPGYKKSPALSIVMKPLHDLEHKAHHDHLMEIALWEAEKGRIDMLNSAAKSAAMAKLKKDQAAEVVPKLQSDPEEPIPRRYVVNNFSLEALGEVMIGNPDGVLAFSDELYGLLMMASKTGNEELHSFLLTGWNGDGRFAFDRIGRGKRYVENVCLSVLGGIQPGRLVDYLTNGGIGGALDSGFANRFQLLTWPDLAEAWENIDRIPNHDAQEAYRRIFERVAGQSPFPNLESGGEGQLGEDVRRFDRAIVSKCKCHCRERSK